MQPVSLRQGGAARLSIFGRRKEQAQPQQQAAEAPKVNGDHQTNGDAASVSSRSRSTHSKDNPKRRSFFGSRPPVPPLSGAVVAAAGGAGPGAVNGIHAPPPGSNGATVEWPDTGGVGRESVETGMTMADREKENAGGKGAEAGAGALKIGRSVRNSFLRLGKKASKGDVAMVSVREE